MINVRLAPFRMIVGGKFQSGETGIAKAAQIQRCDGIAAQAEKAERPALKAIGHLLATTAELDEIIAVTRPLENLNFFLGRFAGQRVARRIVERAQLLLTGIGDWHGRNEISQLRILLRASRQERIAGNERVAAESFAIEKHAARQTER